MIVRDENAFDDLVPDHREPQQSRFVVMLQSAPLADHVCEQDVLVDAAPDRVVELGTTRDDSRVAFARAPRAHAVRP